MAERRAARRALIISTRPSPLLGTPDVSPANTARAARSASEESDLTLRRGLRRRRLGCSTSSTSIPLAFKWRASLRPIAAGAFYPSAPEGPKLLAQHRSLS